MLEVTDVSFAYGEKQILDGVNFSLKQGEIGSLIGASGSGKTTLFRLLTGLIAPRKGKIIVSHLPLPAGNLHVTYMMQEDLLLPWRTVISNMMLTSELGQSTEITQSLRREAVQLLAEMGMAGCEEKFPDQISGGMRQRVALARALLQKRQLILLDEPFGALDVSLREQMYLLLRRIKEKYGTTILLITHDFRDALSLSDKILYLENGVIKNEWTIPPDLRHNPFAMGSMHENLRAVLIKDQKEF